MNTPPPNTTTPLVRDGDEEKLEEVRLKKMKLVLKDEMEAMLAVG